MNRTVTVVCNHEYGPPNEVICVESWELPALEPNSVVVELKASPINPADLNLIEGRYLLRPALPVIPGIEGVGVIAETGDEVDGVTVGQPVIAPNRIGFWCEAYVTDVEVLIPLPDEIPVAQAAMLSVNAPTAWWMLTDYVCLEPGDWIIQNAANSGVGRYIIQLAVHRGLRTLNVVRRPELISELESEGADIVVTDEVPLSKQIRDLIGDDEAKLGLNAVGGESAHEIAKSLAAHGTLVTYGAMGLQPLQIANGLLIFKDIRFRGFMLSHRCNRSTSQEIQEMFGHIFALAKDGKLRAPIAKSYPLTAAREALAHAAQGRRNGKILFVME